ncbi:Alpha/Beta hydrolase protein [Lipomyces arxii]|uniref:Alpha/Beta hydrolase protein n=1 Tax=Lipomyces arxii TaxID=56418 RepID=UPI0034CD4500
MGFKFDYKTIHAIALSALVMGAGTYAVFTVSKYNKHKKTPPKSNPPTLSYPEYALSEHTFLSPTSGRTISYAEYGSPESKNIMIYEHGLPGSRILPVGPNIKGKNIRVLAIDRPGMGLTSLPLPGTTVMETAISDVYELIEHLEITEKVMLCGFSAGGPHVLGIMFTHPQKIRATYCLGPATYLDEKVNWSELSRGSRKSNLRAMCFPKYFAFDMILNADKATDCSNVIANMQAHTTPGDAAFLSSHPVEAKGWQNVNYEAYRQGLTGYLQSCLEIFGRHSSKPWPVVGDIIHQEGIEGQKVTIIHRECDNLTPASGSRDLIKRLIAAGADAEMILIPGTDGGHFDTLNIAMDYILEHEC